MRGRESQLDGTGLGDEQTRVGESSEQVARILRRVPGRKDSGIERLSGQQALTIEIDRKAIARHGVNVADVQALIETAVGGKDVTTLYEGERRYSVTVRFPAQQRSTVEAMPFIQY